MNRGIPRGHRWFTPNNHVITLPINKSTWSHHYHTRGRNFVDVRTWSYSERPQGKEADIGFFFSSLAESNKFDSNKKGRILQ